MLHLIRKYCARPQQILLPFLLVISAVGCAGAVKLDTATIIDANALSPQAVVVKPVAIEFSTYWEKEQRRDHTKADIDDLHQRYTEVLTRSVEKTLSQQGWTIADSGDANAVIASVSINNMRITAPDFKGVQVDLYSKDEHGSGEFTLTLEQQGKLLAEFKDKRNVMAGAGGNQLNRTSRVMNQHAFDRTLKRFIEDALKSSETSQ